MKLILLLFTALFFYTSLVAQTLSGKWFIVEEGDTAILELTKDSIFYLKSKSLDVNFDGLGSYSPELSEDDSVFIDYKYTCYLKTFPHHLVLTGYLANTSNIVFVIPSYFEFRENGSLVLIFHDEGMLFPEDDIEKEIENFYKNKVIGKDDYEMALTFKPIK